MVNISSKESFAFTAEKIAAVVTQKSPGSFILGLLAEDGTFVPRAVGRSDHDLAQELQFQAQLKPTYTAFQFEYAPTPHAAFNQQCAAFHACGACETLENKHHPMRPNHTRWLCPVCEDAFLASE